jgi:hypothetical protein
MGSGSPGSSQASLGSGGLDIPVARRTQLTKPERRFRFRQSLLTATLLLAGTASLIWLFRDPIKRQLYVNFLLDRFGLMREAGIRIENIDGRMLPELTE